MPLRVTLIYGSLGASHVDTADMAVTSSTGSGEKCFHVLQPFSKRRKVCGKLVSMCLLDWFRVKLFVEVNENVS